MLDAVATVNDCNNSNSFKNKLNWVVDRWLYIKSPTNITFPTRNSESSNCATLELGGLL